MPVATSTDIELATLDGHSQTLGEWLTMFNLLAVILDPYTHQSGWIIPTADRLFDIYEEADVRCAFVVTADAEGARSFVGPYAQNNLVLIDPEREFTKFTDVELLPALVHVDQGASVVSAATGWDPSAWTDVLTALEDYMDWRARPQIPGPLDPGPFAGTPAH